MTWQNFQNLKVPMSQSASLKRRYSVTSDVLSFRRCSRQYEHFAVRGYEPAHTVQIYYGMLIHQVLDRAHAHYKGFIDPTTRGKIPTDRDIELYFDEVDSALRARGISSVRAFRQAFEREAALRRLKLFNQIEGPELYPRVRDTEHRLQSDQDDYLLHGTVDVLADALNWLPGMTAEIWDYKGGSRPDLYSQNFYHHEFQMLVYAELYRERNGAYPEKMVLYFLGELETVEDSLTRPSKALVEIPLDPHRIKVALETFQGTVRQIEKCKRNDDWPTLQPRDAPDKGTCNICDIRWNCPAKMGEYPMRYP
jgi:putative RecB family exonuclease